MFCSILAETWRRDAPPARSSGGRVSRITKNEVVRPGGLHGKRAKAVFGLLDAQLGAGTPGGGATLAALAGPLSRSGVQARALIRTTAKPTPSAMPKKIVNIMAKMGFTAVV